MKLNVQTTKIGEVRHRRLPMIGRQLPRRPEEVYLSRENEHTALQWRPYSKKQKKETSSRRDRRRAQLKTKRRPVALSCSRFPLWPTPMKLIRHGTYRPRSYRSPPDVNPASVSIQPHCLALWWRLTPSTPAGPNCCCSKGSAPYWSNPPFLIFDIRALWRSWLSARAPECQKLKMVR